MSYFLLSRPKFLHIKPLAIAGVRFFIGHIPFPPPNQVSKHYNSKTGSPFSIHQQTAVFLPLCEFHPTTLESDYNFNAILEIGILSIENCDDRT